MLKEKFIQISENKDFYENEFLEYYDGDDSKAEGYFQYYLEEFFNRLRQIKESSYGLQVWRVINAKDIDQINLNNAGGSWSYNEKAAHSWYGGDGDSFILEGFVPFESLDLETTLRQNLVNPDEEEFRLESDSLIFISKIMNKDKIILKEFNPPIQSSSGKIGTVGDWTGN